MRNGLAAITDKLRAWLKASLAERTESALSQIDTIAQVALANQQVSRE